MNVPEEDLGLKTDIDAVFAVMMISGLHVLDVGCGPGKIARELHGAGATVLGLEPDPIQAGGNREAILPPGISLVEGRAEQLPIEDSSIDGVFFFRSLHHVPPDRMEQALHEAARVLKRDAGFLCVIEPAVTGTHFPLIRPFHDETRVRAEAQTALDSFATPLFSERRRYRYLQRPRYVNFGAFVARIMGQTFNDIRRDDVETEEVRGLFEAGRTIDGTYEFEQPMTMDLFLRRSEP